MGHLAKVRVGRSNRLARSNKIKDTTDTLPQAGRVCIRLRAPGLGIFSALDGGSVKLTASWRDCTYEGPVALEKQKLNIWLSRYTMVRY